MSNEFIIRCTPFALRLCSPLHVRRGERKVARIRIRAETMAAAKDIDMLRIENTNATNVQMINL